MNVLKINSAKYSRSDNSLIDLNIDLEGLGIIDITINPADNDQAEHIVYLKTWIDENQPQIQPYVEPVISDEQKAEQERQWRDSELKSTDVYLLEDFPISPENKALILTYRQELRDYPQVVGFPNIERPVRPQV